MPDWSSWVKPRMALVSFIEAAHGCAHPLHRFGAVYIFSGEHFARSKRYTGGAISNIARRRINSRPRLAIVMD